MLTAKANNLAVDQNQFEPKDIIRRETVLRQCTPPEFSAMLPPMVQAICDEGSGA